MTANGGRVRTPGRALRTWRVLKGLTVGVVWLGCFVGGWALARPLLALVPEPPQGSEAFLDDLIRHVRDDAGPVGLALAFASAVARLASWLFNRYLPPPRPVSPTSPPLTVLLTITQADAIAAPAPTAIADPWDTCGICGAFVAPERMSHHVSWHDELRAVGANHPVPVQQSHPNPDGRLADGDGLQGATDEPELQP